MPLVVKIASGLRIAGLNPGRGNFGPDGRYYVGLRNARSIMAFGEELTPEGEQVLALAKPAKGGAMPVPQRVGARPLGPLYQNLL